MATKKKTAVAPTAFFHTAVPRVLTLMKATCADLGGSYAIHIDGHGAWTLDFPSACVRDGAAADAQVALFLTLAQFEALQNPKTELKKLVTSGAVRCQGDLGKVENVSLVLAFLAR